MKRSDIIKVSSIQTLGTLDGPGIRFVVFLKGCPLRCMYCHNPETWADDEYQIYNVDDLVNMIMRYTPYFGKDGGVSVSGGEPLVQAAALIGLFKKLKNLNINIVLDTSGCLWNDDVSELLKYVDLCILDIKHTDKEEYFRLTKGNLCDTLYFLNMLEKRGIDTWIRQVIVNGLNDDVKQLSCLRELTQQYKCVKKVELLGFKNICKTKYERLNILFPMGNIAETESKKVEQLQKKYFSNE